jgi:hypothetical protein
MGKKAMAARRVTRRTLRGDRLSADERAFLHARSGYEGVPYHKLAPGDFRLTPPAAPRHDKTLCDAKSLTRPVTLRAMAGALLTRAIDGGLASEGEDAPGFPKQLWVVDEDGQVFEAMYGGSKPGFYHGNE